jgi:hypothetical protein
MGCAEGIVKGPEALFAKLASLDGGRDGFVWGAVKEHRATIMDIAAATWLTYREAAERLKVTPATVADAARP